MNVVGYVRVSTGEQSASGAGIQAQRDAIIERCAQRGWNLTAIHSDTASARTMRLRPGLAAAIATIERGEAAALIVAKLDRLSRSLLDFSALMERSRKRHWALVALDLGVDTTTPAGEMMANVLAVFAQFERRLIGQRTREALAVKRSQGVHLGRRSTLARSTRLRIVTLRAGGNSYAAIAGRLNRNRVATGQSGRQWYPSSIQAVLRSTAADPAFRNNSRREERKLGPPRA